MRQVRDFFRYIQAIGTRFFYDQCFMRASALAYTSLLSLVPFLAVMFAALKGLGVQRRLEPLLLSRLSLNPDTSAAIIGYIDQTNFGTLGALGGVALLLTVISLLGSVETTLNYIWRVTRSRTAWRQVTDYLSVVILTPFLLLTAVTLSSSLYLHRVWEWLTRVQLVGDASILAITLMPIVINAIGLAVLYAVMPNRRPHAPSILIGAIVAGAAWYLVQRVYVILQIGMANYNAIYGALSQLPITLVWLYVSWVVVLGGAEISAVFELGTETVPKHVVHEGAIALEILLRASASFRNPSSAAIEPLRLAKELGTAPEIVIRICQRLEEWGWLVALEGEPLRYVLKRDPAHVELDRLADLDVGEVPRGCSQETQRLLQQVTSSTRQAWRAVQVADLSAATPADEAAGVSHLRDAG